MDALKGKAEEAKAASRAAAVQKAVDDVIANSPSFIKAFFICGQERGLNALNGPCKCCTNEKTAPIIEKIDAMN